MYIPARLYFRFKVKSIFEQGHLQKALHKQKALSHVVLDQALGILAQTLELADSVSANIVSNVVVSGQEAGDRHRLVDLEKFRISREAKRFSSISNRIE